MIRAFARAAFVILVAAFAAPVTVFAVEPSPPVPPRIEGALEVSALLLHAPVGRRVAVYVSERRQAGRAPVYAVQLEVDGTESQERPSISRQSLTIAEAFAAADAIEWVSRVRPAMTRIGEHVIATWESRPFAFMRNTAADAAMLIVGTDRTSLGAADVVALVAALRGAAGRAQALAAE